MAKEKKNFPTFDEIVFEKRNKAYGAFDLRKKYQRTVIISTLLGVIIICTAVIVPYIKAKNIAQIATSAQDAVGAAAQTLHHGQIGFGIAHQLAQIDFFRGARQPHATVFPPLRLNPPAFGEQVGDFHQVSLGNLVVLSNFRDGTEPVFVLAQVH